MSGPAEPTGLCANHGVTEASGKVSHARHELSNYDVGCAMGGPMDDAQRNPTLWRE
jgi:hypothetical protein